MWQSRMWEEERLNGIPQAPTNTGGVRYEGTRVMRWKECLLSKELGVGGRENR